MRINFLNCGYRNCGGCLQLVKCANILTDLGHEVFLTYTASFSFDLTEVRAKRVYSPHLRPDEVPDADAVMCSTWYMARRVADLPASKGAKFAYLQDFENWSGTSEDILSCWRLPVHLVAVANYLRDAAAQHTSKRAAVLPYGIDFERFHPEGKTPPSPQRLVLGGLYNSMARKRFDDLVAVALGLREQGVPVELRLFGAEPGPVLPLPAVYLRQPKPEDLRAMMSACHVWLAMSEQEGLHIPPMEAMACGAVPVVTEIGGMRDYCLDGRTGFQVPVGGVAEAVARVRELWGDPARWERMSAAALAHIRAMGSERENAARLAELFQARQGAAGLERLFDFTSWNQNTWKTLAAYGDQAARLDSLGASDLAAELDAGLARTLEARAQEDRNLLGRQGRTYGLAVHRQNRRSGASERSRAETAFLHAPREDGVLDALAGAWDRPLAGRYDNPAAFDGWLRVYPTLRCTLHCGYCVNDAVQGARKDAPAVDWQRWAEALNREGRHVVFTGGEPFLYKGFVSLLNAMQRHLMLRVYSNLSLDLGQTLAGIQREADFYVSWHASEEPDRQIFLANCRAILDNPLFSLTVHAIDTPENQARLERDLAFFRDHGVRVDLDQDQRGFAGSGQPAGRLAACRRRLYLIGPDGCRYQCVSRLMRRDQPQENIFDGPLGPDSCLSACPDYGNCAPCDGLGETSIGILETL
jgi:glycosyltransferase involved in cell wall biosynthesis